MSNDSTVVLKPIGVRAAEALAAGRAPDVPVAPGYPTEFSAGVGQSAGAGGGLGPFFIHRLKDDLVVGEIGGAFVDDDTIEIGYAIAVGVGSRPCDRRGAGAGRVGPPRRRDRPRRREHAAGSAGFGPGGREGGIQAGG